MQEFNNNRKLALILMSFAGILGWYSTILLTSKNNTYPNPSKSQIYGLYFGLVVSILYWFKQCYSIKLDNSSNLI